MPKDQKVGYQVSIEQEAFTRDDLLNGFPKWDDLHYDVNISDRDAADIYVSKRLDEPLMAPNGFHRLGGSLRDLCGQENIDRQCNQIIDSGLSAGLVTFCRIRFE